MAEIQEQTDNTRAKSNSKLTKIIGTLKNVFLLEHLAGIYRFSFKDGELLPPNWIKKIYALCLMISFMSLYLFFLDLPTVLSGTQSLVNLMDKVPCLIIMFQYVTTLITTNVFFSKANREIFTAVADLDNQLITANIDEFYQKATSKTNKFMLYFILSHVIISALGISAEHDLNICIFMCLTVCLIQKLEIVMFCLVIEMLKSRLEVINIYITKFLDENDCNRISVFTVNKGSKEVTQAINMIGHPSDNNMKIRDLATIYDMIGCICSMVNSVFNFQIFMTLVSTFTYIVITIWTVLHYYQTPGNSFEPLIIIVIWNLATLLTVASMCFVCERLRLTRKNTRLLVNQIIMDYNLPKIMRAQAKAFMELIEAWPLRIMIYDMFSLDITLLLKFLDVLFDI